MLMAAAAAEVTVEKREAAIFGVSFWQLLAVAAKAHMKAVTALQVEPALLAEAAALVAIQLSIILVVELSGVMVEGTRFMRCVCATGCAEAAAARCAKRT